MLIDKDQFRKKLAKLQNLPAFPNILDRFNEMVKDPSISMSQIGDVIGQDQMLSLKLLKLINSAFYGFPGRISTITHALVLLGYDVVKGLILSATVFEEMSNDWQELWKHSLGVSKACGLICEKLKIPDAEEIGMAGLLHDIGKAVLILEEPAIYGKVQFGAAKLGIPVEVAEQKLLGFDHTEVASWLCDRWHLPQRLAVPMTYHHHPEDSPSPQMHSVVVFLADNVTKAIGASAEASGKVLPVPAIVTEMLDINRSFLEELVNDLERELATLPTG